MTRHGDRTVAEQKLRQAGWMAAQGLKDPEAKRKAIGAGFIQVFQEYADSFQADHGFTPKYLVQAGACHGPPLPVAYHVFIDPAANLT